MNNIETILEKLISFKTISSNKNLDLIKYIQTYLEELDINYHLDFNKTQDKANIFFQVGPNIPGGVILSAHTDVVPIEGQEWNKDPFNLTKKNNLYYGRGTCDMKGFISVVLSSLSKMKSLKLKKPFQIALSYDEEVGCLGAPKMISKIKEKLPLASLAIIGEPTSMKVVNSHKTSIGLKTKITGYEVHSSIMHEGVSAIMVSSEIINWLNKQNNKNEKKIKTYHDLLFTPPYTTLHVGKINGGTATNITARNCNFNVDIRCLPKEDPIEWIKNYERYCKKIEKRIKKINRDTSIIIENSHYVPGLKPEIDGAAENLVRKLTGDNSQNSVSYGTEAGQYQEAGYSVVICGPGSIEQAHKENEYISEKELRKCENFIDKLIKENSY